MLVLGVETSCDETGLALVRDGVLAGQVLASQTEMHAVFGGVVPEIASREHQRVLPGLFAELVRATGVAAADIDAVAVARGPGLLGSLLVGLSFAKGLCLGAGAELIGVNHLHAHLLAPGLERDLTFPALGLLVSGGHTHLYRMDSPTRFELLGRTLDDAAGEAFDKVAKLLNLPYPGGRYLDELGQGAAADPDMFPRAYVHNDNLDFSFSGLKTAAAEFLAAHPGLVFASMPDAAALRAKGARALAEHPDELCRVCASFNLAVAESPAHQGGARAWADPGLARAGGGRRRRRQFLCPGGHDRSRRRARAGFVPARTGAVHGQRGHGGLCRLAGPERGLPPQPGPGVRAARPRRARGLDPRGGPGNHVLSRFPCGPAADLS